MPAPSEPEKFSIAEMMERLQSPPPDQPSSDGELVTRSDGSQAFRVRKRKRRSQQPVKEARQRSRRVRMVQVSAALILPLLAVLVAGAAIIFSNSSLFRDHFLHQLALSTGSKVELEQFRMNPASAHVERISLTWPDDNVLRNLTLRNVKADVALSSFLGKTLTGEELSCADASLMLRIPQPLLSERASSPTPQNQPFLFNRYGFPKSQILLGDPAAPLIRLQNSEISFFPVNDKSRAQLLTSRGDLSIIGWPKLRMDRSLIEFRGSDIDVISLRLRHESDNQGTFELSGTLSPYASDHPSSLTIELESFLVAGIIGPDLGRLFSGRIDTLPNSKSSALSFSPAGPNLDASLAIEFRNSLASPFDAKAFPFLFGLSQLLQDNWFERPVFESVLSGQIHRHNHLVAIRQLHLETKNRIALRGSITITPERMLSGDLDVGIPDAIIKSSKNPHLDSLFSPLNDGFRWLPLKIAGSSTTPTDNFKALYEAASPSQQPNSSDSIPSFEDLTRPN